MPRPNKLESQFRYLILILLGFLLYSLPTLAAANDTCPRVNFNSALNYSTGTQPIFEAQGDFNGDGITDLAVANGFPDKNISILLGDGKGGFNPANSVSTDSTFTVGFIAVGDFNNDGKADLALTLTGYGDISVLLGDGKGGFGPPSHFAAGLKPAPIIVRDFNGDGLADLAVGNIESKNVSILLGNGKGGFSAPKNFPSWIEAAAMDIGDFNGDGIVDLVVMDLAGSNPADMTVLIGDGAGNFSSKGTTIPGGIKLVKAADFNKDGKLDVVTVEANGVRMSVNFGDGAGGFTNSVEMPGLTPSDIAVGDFNGDSNVDIAVSSASFNQFSILLGDGTGHFLRTDYVAGSAPVGILANDFNKDGKLDLAIINSKSNNVSIVIGDGKGGFKAARNYAAGQDAFSIGAKDTDSIVSADFNRDGNPDLAVTNYNSENISILLNNGKGEFTVTARYKVGLMPKLAVGDINGDGILDLALGYWSGIGFNVNILLGQADGTFIDNGRWYATIGGQPEAIAVGDFNGDGRADLVLLNQSQAVVFFNGGNQFNAVTQVNVGPNAKTISLGDLNSDGKLDFVVTNSDETSLSDKDGLFIAFGDGAGGFSVTKMIGGFNNPENTVIRDFNGDGNLDLAFTNNPSSSPAAVTVLLGDGHGGFAQPKNFDISSTAVQGIAAGDFDGDGKLDIVATSFDSNVVLFLLGDGTGNFQLGATYSTGAYPVSVTASDFNGDGKSDVATANYISSNVTSLISTPCAITPSAPSLQLSAASYTVNESNGNIPVIVSRAGDTSASSSVNYATSDTAGLAACNKPNTGIASSRCDYATTIGTLQFAAGETTKTIFIPIVNDSYAEGPESFSLKLSNPVGATLGSTSNATITIVDDDTTTGGNPIVDPAFFIRQQYIDFLGREPDPGGLAGWQSILSNCGVTVAQPCDRIEVSAGFFRSPEFQDRGYFVFRFYPAALGRNPNYNEFMPDLAKVSGFLSDAQLEANKVAFVQEFMSRPEFQTKYGSLTDAAFHDALVQTAGIDPGIAFPQTGMTRAQFLRAFVEHSAVYQKFYNQSFVVMQYFGYLRRDPDILYLQWIDTMNKNGGDYRAMINGFMNSSEYFLRFGP